MLSLNYYSVVIEYCRGYWTVVWALKWLSYNENKKIILEWINSEFPVND